MCSVADFLHAHRWTGESQNHSELCTSLKVKFSPYEKHCNVEQKQPSDEPEVTGHSTAKMSFNCLQAAVPQFQRVQQIPDSNTELQQQ